MKANTAGIEIGDIVFLHQPIYNQSDEIVPEEKKVRPYCVLDIIEDDLLVVGLTTKEHGDFTYKIKEASYAIINDLYLINIRELVNIKGRVEDNIFINIIGNIYKAIVLKKHITFDENIQNLFREKYERKIKDESISLLTKKKKFQERDIIYQYGNYNQKYIIDKITEDGYLSYRINLKNNFLDIDFSSQIMLSKDMNYLVVKNVREEEYNRREQAYLRKKYANTHSDYQPKKKVYYRSGDILKHNGKEYFLIYENSDQKLVCIPYKGNYLLDHLKYLKKYECEKLDIRLVLLNELLF